MGHKVLYLTLMFAALVSVSQARDNLLSELNSFNPIKLNQPEANSDNQVDSICEAWRLSVEARNLRDWKTIPKVCASYVEKYMLGGQYEMDLNIVVANAMRYLNTIKKLNETHGRTWIFDLDETMLSDLQYYSQKPDPDFGAEPYNSTKFHAWIAKGNLSAIVPVRNLYNAVLKAGYKVVIISGTPERYRLIRIANLRRAGYTGWSRLILRTPEENEFTAATYKLGRRVEIVWNGDDIVSNIGDQWSDLLGGLSGTRFFKVPNPMYYVA